jgi:hypothetical protein
VKFLATIPFSTLFAVKVYQKSSPHLASPIFYSEHSSGSIQQEFCSRTHNFVLNNHEQSHLIQDLTLANYLLKHVTSSDPVHYFLKHYPLSISHIPNLQTLKDPKLVPSSVLSSTTVINFQRFPSNGCNRHSHYMDYQIYTSRGCSPRDSTSVYPASQLTYPYSCLISISNSTSYSKHTSSQIDYANNLFCQN